MELIIDRTQANVDRVKELSASGLSAMTADEIEEWLLQSHGAYNYTDLNRVETAVEYVCGRLAEVGIVVNPVIKKTWTIEEYPTKSEMERYLENVRKIHDCIALTEDTPEVPFSMEYLNYVEANNIERILLIVDTLISNMLASYLYSGDIYSGEV